MSDNHSQKIVSVPLIVLRLFVVGITGCTMPPLTITAMRTVVCCVSMPVQTPDRSVQAQAKCLIVPLHPNSNFLSKHSFAEGLNCVRYPSKTYLCCTNFAFLCEFCSWSLLTFLQCSYCIHSSPGEGNGGDNNPRVHSDGRQRRRGNGCVSLSGQSTTTLVILIKETFLQHFPHFCP